jgi:F-type H+-transporting ATPase subunit epsilon
MSAMRLIIDTPFGEIVAVDALTIVVPGEVGEMGVLLGHTPLLTLLGIGELRYETETETEGDGVHYVAVARGYVEVSGDTVRVVSEAAEPGEAIDVERAAEAEKRAAEALAGISVDDSEADAQRETHARALKRAQTRQAVAAKV